MANGLSPVPAQLEAAIQKASRTYGVPPDLLEGIWRIESSSTYPNPYANGLGYGGEFGTRITAPFGPASEIRRVPEPPVQSQANTSASILATSIASEGGDIAKGLSKYSGGGGVVPPPQGYDQVPGETTFGNIKVPTSVAPPSIIGPGPQPAVGGGSTQPVSLTTTVANDVTGSVKEALIRVVEFGLALFLGYLALKTLTSAFTLGRSRDAAKFTINVLGAPGAVAGRTGTALATR